jgi:hypothetical protein
VAWLNAAWQWYLANASAINPIATFVGAVGAFATAAALAWAGVQNARTQARRHEEQTKADRQRRITESFSKATEQLASEKIEARLGGIYTLERISRESPDDYWIVMETLTAFLREHARWKEKDETTEQYETTSETLVELYTGMWVRAEQPGPATDIAAVLTVIVRRDVQSMAREKQKGWTLNFRRSDLRRANLYRVHLEGACLSETHLEGAHLSGAHLEGADLYRAHLERARLDTAHLERAVLLGAHFEGANLIRAHLEGACLAGARLKGADLAGAHLKGAELDGAQLEGAKLDEAHLEGAKLVGVKGLAPHQITRAYGDSGTTLPKELTPPDHWASGS